MRTKYVPLPNGNHADPIASFHYFQNVIDVAGEQKMPPHYWRYLQLQVDRLEQQWSQKRIPPERNR